VVSYDHLKKKKYSLPAGQYFDVKIKYTKITPIEFESIIDVYKSNLNQLFAESKILEDSIKEQLGGLIYE